MQAKELIRQLQKLDPEMEVMIQQGGEYDYMTVHGVRKMEVCDPEGEGDDPEDETGIKNIIGIQFV